MNSKSFRFVSVKGWRLLISAVSRVGMVLLFMSSLIGCYRAPGPFESAGRQLDEDIQATEASTEKISDRLDDLIEEIERSLENSGRSLDQAL